MKLVAIGDIHGCADQLIKLLDRIKYDEHTWLVFLGDYIDVGPNSKDVIDLLINIQKHHQRCIFLQGNHERYLLDYINDGNIVKYAKNGGISTIRSYLNEPKGDVHKQFLDIFPRAHKEFLISLVPYFEIKPILFSHAAFDPKDPLDRSPSSMYLKSNQGIFEYDVALPFFTICGHYFSKDGLPHLAQNLICLDTGCGILKGPLSALIFEPSNLYQIGSNGEYSCSIIKFTGRQSSMLASAFSSADLISN